MSRRLLAASFTACALLAAGAAQAQLPGIPYGPVETGTGLGVSADFAQPGNDLGGGSAYGVTAGLGFSRFGLSASLGASKPDNYSGTEVTYGGRFGMKLFGGGLNPITVGAQVGFASVAYDFPAPIGSQRATAFMPAGWVKISPPLFPLKPFGVAYYTLGDNVEEEFRVTVGANFNLILGLGVHGAFDWGDSGSTWGVGAHINLRLPGLPGVPGM